MKKTLTLLLLPVCSLWSIAQGADYTFEVTAAWTSSSVAVAGDFSFTFMLPADTNLTSRTLLACYDFGGGGDGGSYYISYALSGNATDGYKLDAGRAQSSDPLTLNVGGSWNSIDSLQAGVVYTLSSSRSGNNHTVTITDEDTFSASVTFDNQLYAASGTTAGSTKATTYFNQSFKAIPEPATATLSLLALAGLAARRRRK